MWGLGLPAVGVGDQLAAATQQVRQAGLVGRVPEAAVGRPAVALQHAGVALAEHYRRVGVAPTGGDPVDRDLRTNKRP